jgi:hypothetical protein
MLNLHKDHLTSEGFTPEAIEQLQTWGVRSITNQEAKNLGIAYQGYSPSGLWFPFQGNFGQLRCDQFLLKYLSPGGSTATSWNPQTEVVTEGFKDAAAGTLMGLIPTTAIAGVTHYRSLPRRGQTVVFDSDATSNPHVFTALVRAALFLAVRRSLFLKTLARKRDWWSSSKSSHPMTSQTHTESYWRQA